VELNKNLNLNECLIILNQMLKGLVEYDCYGNEVEYIIVGPEKMNFLVELLPEPEDLKEYLKCYGEDWKDEGFDITGVWMEVSYRFKVDIWVNLKKNEFYICQWHDKMLVWLKGQKRNFYNKISRYIRANRCIRRLYRWAFSRGHKNIE